MNKLTTAVWEITMGCNMRCKHCGSSCAEALPDELNTSEALEVCDQDVYKRQGTGREIPGMVVKAFMEGREEIESLQERITGRFSATQSAIRMAM